MNKYDNDYIELIKDILMNGSDSSDRTGTGTRKVFGRMLTHKMKTGFPILTTRKMFYKNGVHELIWFLKGSTNIKYLVDNGVNIWVGDCYKRYSKLCSANDSTWNNWMRVNIDETLSVFTEKEFIEKIKTDDQFAKMWGELGTVYGKEWVDWYGINQVQELIDMLKTNPDNRRLLVTAWNPVNVKKAVLPPCHYAWQVFTRELSFEERLALINPIPNVYDHRDLDAINIPKHEISLMFQIRSLDVPLGCPTDILVYGLLLSMISQVVNMIPGELKMCSGDTHLYKNQISEVKEQLTREPFELPQLELNPDVKNIFDFKYDDIKIVNYQCHEKIIIPLSN